jgi:hypothetical protein
MGSNAGGFNFDLCKRNDMLEKKGMHLPKAWKTGTTIAGIIFKVGVVAAGLMPAGPLRWPLPGLPPGASPDALTLPSQDGVVLGADTRSTSGSTVADKNCEKIHYIAGNIYCCGAGTAADTEATTGVHRPAPPLPCRACAAPRHSASQRPAQHGPDRAAWPFYGLRGSGATCRRSGGRREPCSPEALARCSRRQRGHSCLPAR